jgi:polysaccharide biosynthesis protein PslH
MKKLLVIAPYPYLPFFSGGQKFIANFTEHIGAETDCTVISVADNDFSLAKNYKAIPLLKNSFTRYFDLSLIKKIVAEVKANNYDAIVWEHPYFAWLAFRVRKRTGVKTIIHTHNIEYQRFRSMGKWWWPILKVYERRAFRKADQLFFITPEDKEFAISQWKVDRQKCFDLPFGVEISRYPTDKAEARKTVAATHGIDEKETLLFFNGLLKYLPNLDALKVILEKVNPLLLQEPSFRYKIIVCGKGLPEEMNSLKEYRDKNIIYAGFVDDIETYFKAADIFLNPVQTGGGIKTKMVEALAYGNTVIATATGAAGILRSVCGNKLVVVNDNDWITFAKAIMENKTATEQIPAAFYENYYWGNIAKSVAEVL